MNNIKYPPIILTVTNVGKRCRGRSFQTIRDAFIDGLKIIILNINERGVIEEWIGYTRNESELSGIVKRKERYDRGRFEEELHPTLQ